VVRDDLDFLPALPDDEDLVPSPIVKKENGGISDMTLWALDARSAHQVSAARRRHQRPQVLEAQDVAPASATHPKRARRSGA